MEKDVQKVLNQAKICRFKFQQDQDGHWSIDPKTSTEQWKLKFADDRWLLFAVGIPQIYLSIDEVIAFLKRHR